MKISLTRKYQFSSAHRLNSGLLNTAENIALYDKCNNYNGHGHDYTLYVSVTAEPSSMTGMIIPIPVFDEIIEDILNLVDYKHLDNEVDFFKQEISTAENIIKFLWDKIEAKLEGGELIHLKLWETNNNYFELGRE